MLPGLLVNQVPMGWVWQVYVYVSSPICTILLGESPLWAMPRALFFSGSHSEPEVEMMSGHIFTVKFLNLSVDLSVCIQFLKYVFSPFLGTMEK